MIQRSPLLFSIVTVFICTRLCAMLWICVDVRLPSLLRSKFKSLTFYQLQNCLGFNLLKLICCLPGRHKAYITVGFFIAGITEAFC